MPTSQMENFSSRPMSEMPREVPEAKAIGPEVLETIESSPLNEEEKREFIKLLAEAIGLPDEGQATQATSNPHNDSNCSTKCSDGVSNADIPAGFTQTNSVDPNSPPQVSSAESLMPGNGIDQSNVFS